MNTRTYTAHCDARAVQIASSAPAILIAPMIVMAAAQPSAPLWYGLMHLLAAAMVAIGLFNFNHRHPHHGRRLRRLHHHAPHAARDLTRPGKRNVQLQRLSPVIVQPNWPVSVARAPSAAQ